MNNNENLKLAIFCAIIASIFMAVMSLFVKLIGTHHSTNTIVFARFSIGLLILLPWFLTDKNLFKTPHKFKLFMRSLAALSAIVCMFYALKYLSITNVLVLSNSFPLFIPVIAALFLKINTSPKVWGSIIIGFVGVALVLQPNSGDLTWSAPVALTAGLLIATSMLEVRLLSKDITSLQILFYLFLVSTVITGLLLPFSFHIPTYHDFWLLILVGISGTFYQVFLSYALRNAQARFVSPIFYCAILFSVIFDWWIWSKTPDLLAYIGAGLIIIGGLGTIFFGKSTSNNHSPH